MNKNKRNFIICTISIPLVLVTIYLCYELITLFPNLKDSETQKKLESYISNQGWKGWGLLLIIQMF